MRTVEKIRGDIDANFRMWIKNRDEGVLMPPDAIEFLDRLDRLARDVPDLLDALAAKDAEIERLTAALREVKEYYERWRPQIPESSDSPCAIAAKALGEYE